MGRCISLGLDGDTRAEASGSCHADECGDHRAMGPMKRLPLQSEHRIPPPEVFGTGLRIAVNTSRLPGPTDASIVFSLGATPPIFLSHFAGLVPLTVPLMPGKVGTRT